VAQSIIELTNAPDMAAYKSSVTGRVAALARAQGSLAAQRYEGASIRGVIEHELATLGRAAQYEILGPDWMLSAKQVQPLSMLIHELATNATKHGALSREDGCVRVRISRNSGRAQLEWEETGGPPVSPPSSQGFGSRLIRQLTEQLDGESALEWNAAGLMARLRFPERG
jgi:two-component sensor histidine kinase